MLIKLNGQAADPSSPLRSRQPAITGAAAHLITPPAPAAGGGAGFATSAASPIGCEGSAV